MKSLLITHVDLDGISPIILMNLTKEKFDYKTLDIKEIDEYFDELFTNDIKAYEKIYVVDLSLTEHVYNLINKEKINIKVFDHHETHLFANVYKYVTVKVKYNKKLTCGTELFYNFLKEEYPNLKKKIIKDYVEMVRQLDTFTFIDERPRDLENLRATYGNHEFIKTITRRLSKEKSSFEFTAFEKRLLKIKRLEEENYLKKREEKLKKYLLEGKKCGIVFAERYKSDLGNYLAKKYDDLDFIIIIDFRDGISYRAIKENVNVADIAKLFNGGGHKLASGSPIPEEYREKFIEEYFKVKKLDE